ncbi:SDR family NAD(P)-dependent oxidoreductase [Vannielia sp.]|uniref:SDR family NAD(P)-dependent oxidoreductase n=1 Tax=Vannielia sp. TaxID=2813045 RepID=UPI003BAC2F57
MSTAMLSGTVMVIGGGHGGIGQAIAEKAVANGATVMIWDLSPGAPREGQHAIACDLTSEEAVQAAFDETVSRFGKIHSLVNCAGITGPTAPVERYALADWQRVFAINLTSAFLTSRAVAGHMREAGYGRIVNLASIAGKEGNANQSAYSASKAAMIGLTKSQGKELATSGVLVNCIAPAIIETELIFQMPEEQRAAVLAKVPMGRAGKPAEIAELAIWLASDRCSFTTGATFDASGGRATY